jgi:hypothetical protein
MNDFRFDKTRLDKHDQKRKVLSRYYRVCWVGKSLGKR